MNIIRNEIQRAIDSIEIRPGMEGVGYEGGFIDGLEYAQELLDIYKGAATREIATDVLNWLNQNPLEWEYGGDVDEMISNYFKSKK